MKLLLWFFMMMMMMTTTTTMTMMDVARYNGLGLMITSDGSLNHIMDKVWDAVDNILIPEVP